MSGVLRRRRKRDIGETRRTSQRLARLAHDRKLTTPRNARRRMPALFADVGRARLMLGAVSGVPWRRELAIMGESGPTGAARSLRCLFNAAAEEHRTPPLRLDSRL